MKMEQNIKFMNNEKMNQMIDEAYKNYSNSHWTPPSNPNGKLLSDQLWSLTPQLHNRDTFIKEIKTNPMFSKRWGLKIEEIKRPKTLINEPQQD